MNVRRERRFKFYSHGTVTLLDNPERELECFLLDMSETGLKFVAGEKLEIDDLVVLEIEDHLVLADVRYSDARGNKFAIGAERIHTIEAAAVPVHKTRSDRIRFAVEDYRSRIRSAIARDAAQATNEQAELPLLHRDQVMEAAVQNLIEQWTKESEGTSPDGTLRAAIVERAAELLAEQIPAPSDRVYSR